jgi:ADP-ribosylglycohydrolase
MLGAIIGDMVGSPFEFDENNIKTCDFPLWNEGTRFTDDSVMTVATGRALMDVLGDEGHSDTRARGRASSGPLSDNVYRRAFVSRMQEFGRAFIDVGYGARFRAWLLDEDPQPYHSWGNGSAMRVSPVAWCFDSLEEVEHVAELSASVTHDHPEGIRGAKATAGSAFLARTGASKGEIARYISDTCGYDVSFTLDEIRPGYSFDVSCQGSVPQALRAFLESDSYEDAIRKAISLGGDSDTIAAICGAVAEPFWGIPDNLAAEAISRLAEPLRDTVYAWQEWIGRKGD